MTSPKPSDPSHGVPTTITEIRRGVIAAAPLCTALGPVAALFGALAVAKGLTPLDAFLFSATVYAGASQFVALDLFGRDVPLWSVLLSVFAVNFRHIFYSAALVHVIRPLRASGKIALFPLLVDPSFAFAEQESAAPAGFSVPAWFGFAVFMWSVWTLSTLAGALSGQFVTNPERYALDMLVPLYFLALVMGFRRRPDFWMTAGVSAAVSTAVYHAPAFGIPLGPPWHVTIGAAAGILAATLRGDRDGNVRAEDAPPAPGGAPPPAATGTIAAAAKSPGPA